MRRKFGKLYYKTDDELRIMLVQILTDVRGYTYEAQIATGADWGMIWQKLRDLKICYKRFEKMRLDDYAQQTRERVASLERINQVPLDGGGTLHLNTNPTFTERIAARDRAYDLRYINRVMEPIPIPSPNPPVSDSNTIAEGIRARIQATALRQHSHITGHTTEPPATAETITEEAQRIFHNYRMYSTPTLYLDGTPNFTDLGDRDDEDSE